MPARYAAAHTDYLTALERAELSGHTRRAYASRVAGFLRWLEDTDLDGERAAGDPTGATRWPTRGRGTSPCGTTGCTC